MGFHDCGCTFSPEATKECHRFYQYCSLSMYIAVFGSTLYVGYKASGVPEVSGVQILASEIGPLAQPRARTLTIHSPSRPDHECPAFPPLSSALHAQNIHFSLSSYAHAAISPPLAMSCAGCASTPLQIAPSYQHLQAQHEHHGRCIYTECATSGQEANPYNTYSGPNPSGR